MEQHLIISTVMTYNAFHLVYFLQPEDFDEQHRDVFRAIQNVERRGEPVTLISVRREMKIDARKLLHYMSSGYVDITYVGYLSLSLKQENIRQKFINLLLRLTLSEPNDLNKAYLNEWRKKAEHDDIINVIEACVCFYDRRGGHQAINEFNESLDKQLGRLHRDRMIAFLKQKINDLQ